MVKWEEWFLSIVASVCLFGAAMALLIWIVAASESTGREYARVDRCLALAKNALEAQKCR